MKLTDLVDRINGNVDRLTTDLKYYIGGEHFESNELEITERGLLKESLGKLGFKFHFAFQERDVIFMARNPHLRKAGMVMFAGLCSDASYILRSKDETVITQDYLAILLQSDHFWNYCESHKVGSVNFANNWSTIANYEFDLPAIEAQNDISSKVWAAYRLKQGYKRLLAATDEMVKSAFDDMSRKNKPNGILRDWVIPDVEKAGKKYTAEDTIEYIDISSVDGETNAVTSTKQYILGKAPSRAQQCVQQGDILLSTVRPNLKTIGLIESDASNLVASSGFCVLRPRDGFRELILSTITSDAFTDKMIYVSKGTNYPAFRCSDVLNYPIYTPPTVDIRRHSEFFRQAEKSKFELKRCIENIDKVIKSLING